MSKQQVFTIGTPCHEDWNKMTKVEKGRFCDVCAKCVVDLTGKSQQEIKNLYVENKGNLCGSMPASQYNAVETIVSRNKARPLSRSLRSRTLSAIQIFAASFVAAFGLFMGSSAYGQSHLGGMKKGKIAYVKVEGEISGGVVRNGKPMANVTVVAQMGEERIEGKTNAHGQFGFGNLRPGVWNLSAFGGGFEAYEQVVVSRGDEKKVVLEMEEYLMMGDIAPMETNEPLEKPACNGEEGKIMGDTIGFELPALRGNLEPIEVLETEPELGKIEKVEVVIEPEETPVLIQEAPEVMIAGGIAPRMFEEVLEPTPLEVGQMVVVEVESLEEAGGENAELTPEKLAVEGFEAVVKPVPTSDELTVVIKQSQNSDPIELLIFSTEGKLVKTGAISGQVGSSAKFDISHLPAGVYYLKGMQDDYLFQQKILKL